MAQSVRCVQVQAKDGQGLTALMWATRRVTLLSCIRCGGHGHVAVMKSILSTGWRVLDG